MSLSRREFMLRSGVTLAAASASLPEVLARTSLRLRGAPPDGRILVMLQLSGGNDGLNTVIPFRDDAYHRLRPTLAVTAGQVHKLTDAIGLHPRLDGLKALYDEGRLAVVQGVGYPNPNRSHFESMDIWHTADPTLAQRDTGWLGRAMERCPALHALHLDESPLPLALRGPGGDVPTVRTIESFRLEGGAGGSARRTIERVVAAEAASPSEGGSSGREGAADAGQRLAESDLQFVRRVAVSAVETARRLDGLPADAAGGYPDFGLARRLREIARLIAADFGPRIYYTTLGGFDTHARQNTLHPNLMAEVGRSVQAFYADLERQGLARRVLLLTFSEFGRRAAENASLGTDHGVAAPLFVCGPGVRAGVVGPTPDLSKLEDGDVPHAIDFRRVYATVLDRWLEVASADVLGRRFEGLDLIA